jgi:hypothetical protein
MKFTAFQIGMIVTNDYHGKSVLRKITYYKEIRIEEPRHDLIL